MRIIIEQLPARKSSSKNSSVELTGKIPCTSPKTTLMQTLAYYLPSTFMQTFSASDQDINVAISYQLS